MTRLEILERVQQHHHNHMKNSYFGVRVEKEREGERGG